MQAYRSALWVLELGAGVTGQVQHALHGHAMRAQLLFMPVSKPD